MKVTIVIEDMTQGIFPMVSWEGNGVTDNIETSIALTLAAQVAYLIRRSSEVGALRVVDPNAHSH